MAASKKANVSRVRVLLKTTLTCRICTAIVIFGCCRIQSPFFTQDLLRSVACAHLVNLPRITAILDVVDKHIFSESRGSQSGQSIPGKNKNGRPCGTYCYQFQKHFKSPPLIGQKVFFANRIWCIENLLCPGSLPFV